jgi:hypothetical protein
LLWWWDKMARDPFPNDTGDGQWKMRRMVKPRVRRRMEFSIGISAAETDADEERRCLSHCCRE